MNMNITLIVMAFAAFACRKPATVADTAKPLLLGADLSYVNEVEDAGAVYRRSGVQVDPYKLFADSGCRVVRLRLWHTPSINAYSGLSDVQRSIRRAKAAGMQVLLDFHYSDFWADPGRQDIPAAWKDITDRNILGDSLYGYTYRTLMTLHREGLLPEMVQTGNEINGEILQPAGKMPSSTGAGGGKGCGQGHRQADFHDAAHRATGERPVLAGSCEGSGFDGFRSDRTILLSAVVEGVNGQSVRAFACHHQCPRQTGNDRGDGLSAYAGEHRCRR
jgi:hypothetical protein